MKGFIAAVAALCLATQAVPYATRSQAQNAAATDIKGALWTLNLPAEIKWHRSTLFDVPLIQTEKGLYGINGATGEQLWEIPGVVVERDDVSEVADVLVVNVRKTQAEDEEPRTMAVETLTGKVRWDNPKIEGRTLAAMPVLDRGQILLVNSKKISKSTAVAMAKQFALGFGGNKKLSVKPEFYAVDVATGNVAWHDEYPNKVDLFKGTSTFGGTEFTITGSPAPTIDGDDLFVPWAGFAKYDLKSGKRGWMVEYDTTIEDTHQTGTYVLKDGTAYTSEQGVVRAIALDSGKTLWTAKGFGQAVPQLFVEPDRVYAKVGGVFYNSNAGKYVSAGKKAFVALGRSDGKVLWKFDKISEDTTNAVRWQNGFVFADAKTVYGIGDDGKELFRQQVKFGSHPPYSCQLADNDLLEIRSEQQRALFNIQSRSQVYNIEVPRPDVPVWKRLVAIGIAVGGSYAGGALGSSGSIVKQLAGVATIVSTQILATKLASRPSDVDRFDFFLSAADDDKNAKSIVRVNRLTGEKRTVAAYGALDVSPVLDTTYGRVYSSYKSTLVAHNLMGN